MKNNVNDIGHRALFDKNCDGRWHIPEVWELSEWTLSFCH